MAYTNFITITDITETSPLWDGSNVTILASSFTMSSANEIEMKPKTFQETGLEDGETTYIENFDRRKNTVSFGGFSNHLFTIKLLYNPNEVSAVATLGGSLKKIFTPSKLADIILNPRTLYLKDQTLFDLLSVDEIGGITDEGEEGETKDLSTVTSSRIYTTNGFPVLLRTWDMVPSMEGKEVAITLKFTEDKGVTTD